MFQFRPTIDSSRSRKVLVGFLIIVLGNSLITISTLAILVILRFDPERSVFYDSYIMSYLVTLPLFTAFCVKRYSDFLVLVGLSVLVCSFSIAFITASFYLLTELSERSFAAHANAYAVCQQICPERVRKQLEEKKEQCQTQPLTNEI